MPAEYSDELAGEGSTEFEDIENGGLGEGEGTKDVSDQIETEDQVKHTHSRRSTANLQTKAELFYNLTNNRELLYFKTRIHFGPHLYSLR